MDQEDIVYDLLTVSGIKKSKARKLARVIASIYAQYQRPDEEQVKKRFDRAAKEVTRFAGEKIGGVPTEAVRQRIREILFDFYMEVATNGTYDVLKYLFLYLLTFFAAAQGKPDVLDKMMRKAAKRFRQASDSLPSETAKELFAEIETINLFKDMYKERIKGELLKDDLTGPLFKDLTGNLNLLSITMSFEDVFID